MKLQRRSFLMFSLFVAASLCHGDPVAALDTNRAERFLPEERRIIEEYYHKSKKAKQKGLPPGLAKRGGNCRRVCKNSLIRTADCRQAYKRGWSHFRLI